MRQAQPLVARKTARRGAGDPNWSDLSVRRREAMISYSLLREAVGSVVNQFDDELGGAVVNG